MTTQEAIKEFNQDTLTFDIEETWSNGDFYISISDPFDSKEDAEKFIEELKKAKLNGN